MVGDVLTKRPAVKLDELYAFQYLPDYFSEVDGWKFYNPEVRGSTY